MRKIGLGLLLVLACALALYWAPWLSAEAAEQRVEAAFTAAWAGVADGCGISCQGCGAKGAARAAFGWRVEIEYACGLLPPDRSEYHRRTLLFVSALGTVHEADRRWGFYI